LASGATAVPITNGTPDTINLTFTTATSTKVFTYQHTITISHFRTIVGNGRVRAGSHCRQWACSRRSPLPTMATGNGGECFVTSLAC
jgi:hypothetical protein